MPSLDIDIDIDDLNTPSGVRNRRVHPGSDVPNALVNHSGDLVPPAKPDQDKEGQFSYRKFHKYWDPDLQACTYLNAFLVQFPKWLPDFVENLGRR
jgi:hypothetical protein